MQLLTKEIIKKLPALRETEGQGKEAVAQVKFFTPDSNWTWYGVEYDAEQRMFFGLVDGFEKEIGYFGLDELEEIKGPFGLKVERDRPFAPTPLMNL